LDATNRSQDAAERRDAFAGMAGLPSLRAAVEQATSEYRRPKLRITDVRTAEVRVHGYQVHVRIYTDQGIVGQGESTDAASGNVPIICILYLRPNSGGREIRSLNVPSGPSPSRPPSWMPAVFNPATWRDWRC